MQQFGKYVLIEPIATGGMAEVFKALWRGDSGFERTVAIKRILPHLTEDEDFIKMFIDEAKIAVQLSHANIAQILDLGREGSSYFIALEYIDGRDLRAVLERERENGRAVPVDMATHIVMKVASALHHAHAATGRDGQPLNIIHRDVSPQNVLVSFEGEVKVIDFGLARAAGRLTQTQAGVVKGKLAYISPQQALGEPFDHRSDIFSLGVSFYEMLTGYRLYHRKTDVDTLLAVQACEVVPPRQCAPHIPVHLEAILMRTLQRDPNMRYQTAMDLHDDLEVFVYESGNVVTRHALADYLQELFQQAPTAARVAQHDLAAEVESLPPDSMPPDMTRPADTDPPRPGLDVGIQTEHEPLADVDNLDTRAVVLPEVSRSDAQPRAGLGADVPVDVDLGELDAGMEHHAPVDAMSEDAQTVHHVARLPHREPGEAATVTDTIPAPPMFESEDAGGVPEEAPTQLNRAPTAEEILEMFQEADATDDETVVGEPSTLLRDLSRRRDPK